MAKTIEVQRRGSTVAGKVETGTGFATVHASLTYLEIAPMNAWHKATLVGTARGKVYKLSWEGGEEIRHGDRVIWKGKKYSFEYDSDDQDREEDALVPPYQTGILREDGA